MKWLPFRLLAGLLLAFVVLLPPHAARANHSVGGELELLHQSGSTYLVRIILYIDANSQAPNESSLIASFFERLTDRRLLDVTVPLVSTTPVTYTSPTCTAGGLNTLRRVYEKQIDLAASTYTSPNGYYVAVEHCCRNDATTNILDPSNEGQTFYLEFAAVSHGGQAFVDSSPTDFPPLTYYACLGEDFTFDFGGRDPDGDSLAYDMVAPLAGHATRNTPRPASAGSAPYDIVRWTNGTSTQAQVTGAPTLTVDARTGRLHVRPMALGLYVFGVRCRQFRGGQPIGLTIRDYQLYVRNCPQNLAPSVAVQPGTTGATYYVPGRDTLRYTATADHCLRVRFTDRDATSALTVTAVPVNFSATAPGFSGATSGTVRAGDTLTATLCFPACVDTKGQTWLLDLIVADNGCPQPKRDTVRVAFTATLPPNAAPVLTSTFPAGATDTSLVVVRLPLGETYTAHLSGTDADGDPLTLTAAAAFDLSSAGMRFTAQNGAGQASADFSWTTTCEAARLPQPLTVAFQLQQQACEVATQAKRVRFEVITTPDTTAYQPPNVITPNGDGLNDYFELPPLPADVCEARFADLKVYSRWGRLVYTSEDRAFRWGGLREAAVYYYVITYHDGTRAKGWLQVLP